ncbi:MAG TPA: DUF5947 family protein [Ktedonobacterales bacterium]|nr:DUF5947 family protein [Ktedonobacterales bacterium]
MTYSGGGDSHADTRVPIEALRRLARKPAPPELVERCELCGVALAPEHRHLLDRASGTLACACSPCALLFEREGAAHGKYLTVPRRTIALDDFQLSAEQWDDLMIPVNMAFIYVSSVAGRAVAYYPSPAGATESLLNLEHWVELVQANPILTELAPDVEALLINRVRDAHDVYLVPIDACYQLVGLIRTTWRGLGGGAEVWTAIAAFFAALRERAIVVEGGAHA